PPATPVQTTLRLQAPAGRYRSEWLDPVSGRIVRSETHDHQGGPLALASPPFGDGVALAVRRLP
ncbi:MAG: hypothetical protein D6766_08440, partial [Verrucomicrobia bacterium]